MADGELCVVTGVSGYSGRHIARRLIAKGKRVINLTGHPERPHEFGDQVTSVPFNFDKPDELRRCLAGADVFYNTYWIRFERCGMTFDRAVQNSKTLIEAARDAGVRRIVHTSVTNPSPDSPLPYYKGKALVEEAIEESELSYAILRPNVLFGDQGILINNIAWFLRHLPVFGVPGSGEYKMQPIFVEDLADLAVAQGDLNENTILDAVGPEIYTFNDLLKTMKEILHSRTIVLRLPPGMALLATGAIGKLVHDIVLTPDEVAGLSDNLLVSDQPPTGTKPLSEWMRENVGWLGTRYFSELGKHFR